MTNPQEATKPPTDPAAVPQAIRALQLANQVRAARAQLKTRVAAGELNAAEVILTCPFGTSGMPIVKLLNSQRGWGQARCRGFLARVPLDGQKQIGSLTERQRRAIASLLTHTTARTQIDRPA